MYNHPPKSYLQFWPTVALSISQVHIGSAFQHQGLKQISPDLFSQIGAGAGEQGTTLLIQVVGLNGTLGDVPRCQASMTFQQWDVHRRVAPLVLHIRIMATIHQELSSFLMKRLAEDYRSMKHQSIQQKSWRLPGDDSISLLYFQNDQKKSRRIISPNRHTLPQQWLHAISKLSFHLQA